MHTNYMPIGLKELRGPHNWRAIAIHPPQSTPSTPFRQEGRSTERPGRFTPGGKDTVRIVQKAGWASRPIWTGEENLAPTGARTPYRPARSESYIRLGSWHTPHITKYLMPRSTTS